MARKLVLLHMKHPHWYAVLNALVNIFVKGSLIAVFMWAVETLMERGGIVPVQSAQVEISNFMIIIISILGGMMAYLLMLAVWQIIKLIEYDYKKINIRVHIFGIIILLGRKKLIKSDDAEAMKALEVYDEAVELRKEKIYAGKERAYNRRREKDEWELQYAKEQRDKYRSRAADSKCKAEDNYRKARDGGGWFTSASEEAEMGRKNMSDAHYYEEQAAYEERKIAELEQRYR